MSQSLLNSEAQNQSPHVDFNTPNQRKRTHSMAETSYLSGPDQLQELSRGSAPTPNMSAAAAHAPVHALPEHARDSVQGLEPDILDGCVKIYTYIPRLHTLDTMTTSTQLFLCFPTIRTSSL